MAAGDGGLNSTFKGPALETGGRVEGLSSGCVSSLWFTQRTRPSKRDLEQALSTCAGRNFTQNLRDHVVAFGFCGAFPETPFELRDSPVK